MKRKIAYCTPSLYLPGGVERVLTAQANYLAAGEDYEIYIILTDGADKKPYYSLLPQIQVIQLNIGFEELWPLSFYKKLPVYLKKQRIYKKRLREALCKIRPDITVSLLRREINFLSSIRDGSRKVGWLHVNKHNYRNFEEKDAGLIKKWFQKYWMYSLVCHLKKLDGFVVLTEEDKRNWIELDNVTVIPNPLPFYPERCSDLSSRQVIAVGRYVYQKGFDLLLAAWREVNRKHPDWILKIYGKGDKSEYIHLAEQYGVAENCILEDAVENITEKYCESSVFVLSSRFEGFGMVIIEAMSCGLPVVSFACPCGPRDIISPEVDGLLVANGNIRELAEKLNYIIENNEQRKEMGKNARKNSRRYDMERIGVKWKELFEAVVSKK